MTTTIEEINERIAVAKEKVINGEISSICYFMELHKMDISILSSYVGLWKWRVKRHFKPKVFATLSDKILQKYAAIFSISIEDLRNFKTD